MPASKGKIKYTEQEILNNSFNENTALIESQIYGQDSINNGARKISVNESGQLEVEVKKSVLPNGAATSENQLFGFINFKFDSVYLTNPDTVTEVYTYKLAGATVATITIIYTDATKETLVSCIRS